MTVDEWIEEFKSLSPVETDGMDFAPAAEIAVECGISPMAVLHHIASMSREDLADIAIRESEPVCLARRSMRIKPLDHILSIDRSVSERSEA